MTEVYRIQKSTKNGQVYYYKMNINKHNASVRKRHYQVRMIVLSRLGGKCVRCGFDDPRALQIDHLNGNAKDDPNSRYAPSGHGHGSILIYNLLKMSDEELKSTYQLLCANCNWIKRHENKEWGHHG